jgi:SNF2 domain-containing protein
LRIWLDKSLIICPVTLIANWEAEAKRFFPGTSVVHCNEPKSKMALQWNALRGSRTGGNTVAAKRLQRTGHIPWNAVVLDQAHGTRHQEPEYPENAKNEAHPGAHKLALTGSSIQNSASDFGHEVVVSIATAYFETSSVLESA